MANPTGTPRPIELCLERVGSSSADRYVRCTAQVGRELGLALGVDGRILWSERSGAGCEIWVSGDQRLMAYCLPGTPTTTLHRAGRVLELPSQRPVVLRHHDEIELAGTRFRVHVHGTTDVARAPTIVRTLARAAAAATLALGMGGAPGCSTSPRLLPSLDSAPTDARDGGGIVLRFDANTTDQAGPSIDGEAIDAQEFEDAPIEVLDFPPAVE
jgi:hypothetical protein